VTLIFKAFDTVDEPADSHSTVREEGAGRAERHGHAETQHAKIARMKSFASVALVALGLVGCRMTDDSHAPDAGLGSAPTAHASTASTAVPAPATAATAPTAHLPAPAAALAQGEPWNPKQIDWLSLEAGLQRAKTEKKPVCLVLYTTWCPHCRNYGQVFADPRVVERARRFVMIRIDADADDATSKKYSPDGTYIPRTFFLGPDGKLDATLHADRPQFQYFYDEHDPSALLRGMDAALLALAK
jgi:hypothetical protein